MLLQLFKHSYYNLLYNTLIAKIVNNNNLDMPTNNV